MAAARDQAARAIRTGPETAEGEAARDGAAQLADQLRTQLAEETKRRPGDAPGMPAADKPAAPAVQATAAAAAAPKSGKKKFVMIGVVGLLALAAISYGVYYVFAGRFYVSTDDAYVRANNTTLGARVSGHVAAIIPGDNSIVRKGDVIYKIDDGDYRIAVDAARTKIAT
jgi:membrane fusion protein (multidrug efflux system)